VIIVDDGIATGHTVLAAIHHVRRKNPAKIIVAIPVATHEAVQKIKASADQLIILYQPDFFTGISAFYDDFKQLTNEEAAACFGDCLRKTVG
jgi:predicted phosphoribosyltransferase